jgi:hypothetical protein
MASFREVDRDTGVQLSVGESQSGTLTWNIDSQLSDGKYTLRVKSDNDVAETTVTVGNVIPSSIEYRWPHNEGSGTTLGDSIGGIDMTIHGSDWVSGEGAGGYHLNHDGSNNYVNTGLSGQLSNPTQTTYGWVNPDNWQGGDQYFWAVDQDSSGNSAWWVRVESGSVSFRWLGLGAEVRTTALTDNSWQFFAASVTENGTLDAYHADVSDSSITAVGSASAGTGPRDAQAFGIGANGNGGFKFDGQTDDIYYTSQKKFTESEFQSEFERTKGNYQ